MARLDILEGSEVVQSCVVEDELVIGRSTAGQEKQRFLGLADNRISRQHARITRLGWSFMLEDMGSSNGTILRGEVIPSNTLCDLYDGDDIWLASAHLVFYAEEDKLTLFSGPELLPGSIAAGAEPAVIQSATESDLPMVRQVGDLMNMQVSAILDASVAMQLAKIRVPAGQSGEQEALRRLHAMCQMSAAVGVLQDRETLLSTILDTILDIFPVVDRAFILLRHDDGEALVPAAVKQRHATDTPDDFAISQSVAAEVMTKKHAVRSLETCTDAPVNPQDSIVAVSMRSILCVPLLVDTEEVLGLMQVETMAGPYGLTDQDLELLTSLGAQAARALKNVQLYELGQQEAARRASLQRSFSPKLVDLCMSGAVTTALRGQTYRGAILFADLKRFAATSATLPPAQVIGYLQQYVTTMQRLIYEHGGHVDKSGGNTIMAFWGVPQHQQEEESEAVRTALHMQARLWPLYLQGQAEGQSLDMGIGVHTGEWIAGNIGSEEQVVFTLLGENVELAARIMQLAAPGQVLVSEAIWEPMRHLVGAIRLQPRAVQRGAAPLAFYAIRSIRHRQRSTCLLYVPCTIVEPNGKATGYGVLTESTAPGKRLRLFFSTATPLQLGTILTLQPVVPEYHELLACTARVESCARHAHDGQQVYTKAILTVVEGGAFTELITPGNCLRTARPWEAMPRE